MRLWLLAAVPAGHPATHFPALKYCVGMQLKGALQEQAWHWVTVLCAFACLTSSLQTVILSGKMLVTREVVNVLRIISVPWSCWTGS